MARAVSFTGERLTRYLAANKRWQEARDWRAKETEAGRSSAYDDFCKAHGLCSACAASGVGRNGNGVGFKVLGWSDSLPLYEECQSCGGTGRIVNPS